MLRRSDFSTLSIDNGNYTRIDYLGGGTNPAPTGTANPPGHSFVWTGPVAGFWNATANWADGGNPASYAPGQYDLVTIGAAANGAAQVVVGNGNAESLTLDGETLLDGTFTIGSGVRSESEKDGNVYFNFWSSGPAADGWQVLSPVKGEASGTLILNRLIQNGFRAETKGRAKNQDRRYTDLRPLSAEWPGDDSDLAVRDIFERLFPVLGLLRVHAPATSTKTAGCWSLPTR